LPKHVNCENGFYLKLVEEPTIGHLKPLIGRKICLPCHPKCRKCTGPSFLQIDCQQCVKFKRNDICVSSCAEDQYDDEAKECRDCSPECKTCDGAGPDHCRTCKEFEVPTKIETIKTCVLKCPDELPSYDVYRKCTVRSLMYIEITYGAVIIFCIMLVLILICYREAQKARNERIQMSLLAGLEDTVPLCQTGASPNMRSIRTIKEAEIRKGGVLGTGEFGQVLKGLWMPENEKYKIPIAIKSFKNMVDSESSAEFMAEAQIMASLDHPHILKLMAICLAKELMMITQLMPLGNLLGYVRKHRDKIDSKTMMNWFVQIAQGMTYLEGRRLVHRDLAARNVLVHTPTSVRIADFGMTKLLKHDTLAYKSADGKVAVRWLAPECMYHKVFTSKSDVWAFGVTVWEVLTYGSIPYSKIKSRDIPQLVTAGEKLPMPKICSLELYTELLLCWNLNPELRPPFSALKNRLTEMASDPARYLVIAGDKLMRLPELTKKGSVSLYAELAKLDCGNAEIVETERYVDNYLLPNPSYIASNGTDYLQTENASVAETAAIQISEISPATGDAQNIIVEAATEPGQISNSLGRSFMNMIRNQRSFAYNRVRYLNSSRP
jgi:epidermal growth factor receptor